MKILFTAAIAVAAFAVTPASAAKMMTCAKDGPTKVGAMLTPMPETPKKMAVYKQVAMMNAAMSKGDMRACNKAIIGAQKAAMMK